MRRSTYFTMLPHIKNLSEQAFNNGFWPIDEENTEDENSLIKRKERAEKVLRERNLKQSEARRKKDNHE